MRVVLPSPNGATLSLAGVPCPVLAGCLRNATAVARAVGPRVSVIPAGEQWPNGSLRPCLEDWLGAGAIVDVLAGELSSEAETARETFRWARKDLRRLLDGCTSGRELADRGYSEDVRVAAALNVSSAVPALREGGFCAP